MLNFVILQLTVTMIMPVLLLTFLPSFDCPVNIFETYYSYSLMFPHPSRTSVTAEVYTNIFGALAKLLRVTISIVMSVCPHGTTWLPLDRFL
jgi:hypothetical protein